MEYFILAGLASVGYYLNQTDEATTTRAPLTSTPVRVLQESNYKPSGINVYTSDRTDVVKAQEQRRADDLYKMSADPWKTHVIPTLFNTVPGANIAPAPYLNPPEVAGIVNKRTLNNTVEEMNNSRPSWAVPYFRGTLKQNMQPEAFQDTLATYTGTSKIAQAHKTEAGPLFQPFETRTDSVNGFYESGDRDTSRFYTSFDQQRCATLRTCACRARPQFGANVTGWGWIS